jgi:hypothetical protein
MDLALLLIALGIRRMLMIEAVTCKKRDAAHDKVNER